jgi:hypothetical protein
MRGLLVASALGMGGAGLAAFLEREVERDEATMRHRYAIGHSPLPVAWVRLAP